MCRLLTTLSVLLSPALTTAQPAPAVNIVSEDGCPLTLHDVTVSAAPTGVSITYSIRNAEADAVREVVITAAALNDRGEVVSLRMLPVAKRIGAHGSKKVTVSFADLDLKDAESVSVGIQGVRWSAARPEWSTALRVNGSGPRTPKN